jgi:hypothetical protein
MELAQVGALVVLEVVPKVAMAIIVMDVLQPVGLDAGALVGLVVVRVVLEIVMVAA